MTLASAANKPAAAGLSPVLKALLHARATCSGDCDPPQPATSAVTKIAVAITQVLSEGRVITMRRGSTTQDSSAGLLANARVLTDAAERPPDIEPNRPITPRRA